MIRNNTNIKIKPSYNIPEHTVSIYTENDGQYVEGDILDANSVKKLIGTGGGTITIDDTVNEHGTNAVSGTAVFNHVGDKLLGLKNAYDGKFSNIDSNIQQLTTKKQDKLKVGSGITITADNTISTTGSGTVVVEQSVLPNSTNAVSSKAVYDYTESEMQSWWQDFISVKIGDVCRTVALLKDSVKGWLEQKQNLLTAGPGIKLTSGGGVPFTAANISVNIVQTDGTDMDAIMSQKAVHDIIIAAGFQYKTYVDNQLAQKQNKLIAGDGISITNDTIKCTATGGIAVDNELKDNSTNPVQNKVIFEKFRATDYVIDHNQGAIETALNTKQDKLIAGSGIDITGNVIKATTSSPQLIEEGDNQEIRIGSTAKFGTTSSNNAKSVAIGSDVISTTQRSISMGHYILQQDSDSITIGQNVIPVLVKFEGGTKPYYCKVNSNFSSPADVETLHYVVGVGKSRLVQSLSPVELLSAVSVDGIDGETADGELILNLNPKPATPCPNWEVRYIIAPPVSGTHDISIGKFNVNDGKESISIGKNLRTTTRSIAIGSNSRALSDTGSISIGTYLDSFGSNSVTIGCGISATNDGSVAVGDGFINLKVTAAKGGSTFVAKSDEFSNLSNLTDPSYFENATLISKDGLLKYNTNKIEISGTPNKDTLTITVVESIVRDETDGEYILRLGLNNSQGSFLCGTSNIESSYEDEYDQVHDVLYSAAFGHVNCVEAPYAFAAGKNNIIYNDGEVAFGTSNYSKKSTNSQEATQFSIGNGGENRSNALELKKNGDLYLQGLGDYYFTNNEPNVSAKSLQQTIRELQLLIALAGRFKQNTVWAIKDTVTLYPYTFLTGNLMGNAVIKMASSAGAYMSEYRCQLLTQSTVYTLTFDNGPTSIKWETPITLQPNKIYQFHIINGYGSYKVFNP